jgi:hypothetical protein
MIAIKNQAFISITYNSRQQQIICLEELKKQTTHSQHPCCHIRLPRKCRVSYRFTARRLFAKVKVFGGPCFIISCIADDVQGEKGKCKAVKHAEKEKANAGANCSCDSTLGI